MNKKLVLKELQQIPGVGISTANDLWNIGIRGIADLLGRDPLELFEQSNKFAGCVQDRCLLYIFRTAVYYAETEEKDRESEKLKWWNWKDEKMKA
ncbi:MAG: pathogenicity locus [Ignavibacteria bacterium]|jgi:hypothetical protein|nr:pathogenicity locus [Ignavibacteria bacterium]